MVKQLEKRLLILDAPEVRAEGDKPPVITGYAAKFNSRSELIMGRFYEVVAKGAFADSLVNDDIRALIDHDSKLVLGRNRSRTLKLREDDIGLQVEISPPDTQYARDVMVSVKRGDITGMSFAFITEADSWDFSETETAVRTLNKVSLNDVSIVTFPAYTTTEVDIRSFERGQAEFNGYAVDYATRRLRSALSSR
jgi:HK97 family phage prohead protease